MMAKTLYYTPFRQYGYTNQTARPTTTQPTTTQADKHEASAKPQQSGPLIRRRVKQHNKEHFSQLSG